VYPGTAQIFGVAPIISGMGKAANVKFCTRNHRIDRNKSPLKILAKVAVGILGDSRNFSGHPYIGRIARSPLRTLSNLVILYFIIVECVLLPSGVFNKCMHI